MGQQRMGLVAAAAALGKSRKTLQRWRKRPGAPFGPDGDVELGELRGWAAAQGLLERTQEDGARPEVDRLLADAGDAGPSEGPTAAAPALSGLRADHARERLALDQARRKLQEAKAAKLAGELVPFDEVRAFWARQAGTLKGGLEDAAARIAAAIADLVRNGCPVDRLEAQGELVARDAHDDVLRQLAADVEIEGR